MVKIRLALLVIFSVIMSALALFNRWHMIIAGVTLLLISMVVRWAFTPREWW